MAEFGKPRRRPCIGSNDRLGPFTHWLAVVLPVDFARERSPFPFAAAGLGQSSGQRRAVSARRP